MYLMSAHLTIHNTKIINELICYNFWLLTFPTVVYSGMTNFTQDLNAQHITCLFS